MIVTGEDVINAQPQEFQERVCVRGAGVTVSQGKTRSVVLRAQQGARDLVSFRVPYRKRLPMAERQIFQQERTDGKFTHHTRSRKGELKLDVIVRVGYRVRLARRDRLAIEFHRDDPVEEIPRNAPETGEVALVERENKLDLLIPELDIGRAEPGIMRKQR